MPDASNDQAPKRWLAIHWFWLIITLLVFFALVKLGFWQSDRAFDKQQRLKRIAQLQQTSAFSLHDVMLMAKQTDDEAFANINDLPVVIKGSLVEQPLFLLDNQMHEGKFGYRVLQRVNTEFGSVLLNLGWHQGDRTRQTQPVIKPLSGDVTVKANIRVIETGIMLQSQQFELAPVVVMQQIELEKIAQLIDTKLLPFVAYLDKNESIGFVKHWQPIVMPPEKHQAYAFQWFSLATAWLLLMIWAARKAQLKINNEQAQINNK